MHCCTLLDGIQTSVEGGQEYKSWSTSLNSFFSLLLHPSSYILRTTSQMWGLGKSWIPEGLACSLGVARRAKKSTLPDESSQKPKHVILNWLYVSLLIMKLAVLYEVSYLLQDLVAYTYDIFVNCNWVVTRWHKYSTHLHTSNTQSNTTILEECGPCPVLASYTLAFALQPRKKHGKTSVWVAASKNT